MFLRIYIYFNYKCIDNKNHEKIKQSVSLIVIFHRPQNVKNNLDFRYMHLFYYCIDEV